MFGKLASNVGDKQHTRPRMRGKHDGITSLVAKNIAFLQTSYISHDITRIFTNLGEQVFQGAYFTLEHDYFMVLNMSDFASNIFWAEDHDGRAYA